MTSNAWSKEDTELIVAWHVLGMSYDEIASQIGRSRQSVKNRISYVQCRHRRAGETQYVTDEESQIIASVGATNRRDGQERQNGKKDTLCWQCKHSTGKYGFCAWFIYRNWVAVEGWDADQTYLASNTPENRNSYNVRRCPQFDKEVRRA